MGKKYRVLIVIVLSLMVIGFFFSIYITVDEKMPKNTVVVVTIEDKYYHSIHFDHICVSGKTARTMTLAEAMAKGFRPHAHDEDLGYFQGTSRFLFHHILSMIGFQVNSRWDSDGNWLW